MKERICLISVLAVIVAFSLPLTGSAQEKPYPNRQIQLVVASRAGGGVDLFYRLLSEELKKMWKVPITIENQPAAGGATAANAVLTAKKDGYTMLGTLVDSLTTLTAAKPQGAIHVLRDFDPVFIDVGYASSVYLVRSDSKFKTLKEIVAYSKEKPGELICGTSKAGTTLYLVWAIFKRSAKVDITTITYSGTAESMPQLLGGHIQIAGSSDVATKPYVDSGRVRVIATDVKSPIFPEVPTFVESGYPEVNLSANIGLFGPKGLPPSVIKAWETGVEAVRKNPEFTSAIKKVGLNANLMMGTDRLDEHLKKEVERFSQLSPQDLGWD